MDRKFLLALPLLAALQCTGTETENPVAPLASFHGSECKKNLPIAAKSVPPPDGGAVAGDTGKAVSFDTSYDGLQCIAWQQLDTGVFRFELGNFPNSCGIDDWKGSASITDDGSVVLHAINSGCRAAGCGSCLYDWSFDVRGVSKVADAHLLVSVVNDDGSLCPSNLPPYDVTLPTTDAAQGILCRPADRGALFWQAGTRGTTGELNMPCDAATPTSCVAGFSCGPLASPDDLRCLAPCSDDSDCSLPGVLRCQDGTCRLTQTW